MSDLENSPNLQRVQFRRVNRDSDDFNFPTLASLKNPPVMPTVEAADAQGASFIRDSIASIEGLITLQPPPAEETPVLPIEATNEASETTERLSELSAAATLSASSMLSLIPLTTHEGSQAAEDEILLETLPAKRISLASLPSDLDGGSPLRFFQRAQEEEVPGDAISPGSRTLQTSFLEFLIESPSIRQPQRPVMPESPQSTGHMGADSEESARKRRRLDSSICVVVAPLKQPRLTEPEVWEMLGLCESEDDGRERDRVMSRFFSFLSADTAEPVFHVTESVLDQLLRELRHWMQSSQAPAEAAGYSGLVEAMNTRQGDFAYLSQMKEHVTQVKLQMRARVEKVYSLNVEVKFGEYLVEALMKKGEVRSRSEERKKMSKVMKEKMLKLLEKVERKKINVMAREEELENIYRKKEVQVKNGILEKKLKVEEMKKEIIVYERAIEDQTQSVKGLYMRKIEILKRCKEHFLMYGWCVCRDGVKEMIVQIPRVRIYLAVVSEERGNHKVVEFRKMIEGPYNFMNSPMINFSLSSVVKTLVEGQLGVTKKFSFSPETFSDWAAAAIRTASAVEELAQVVQNVAELIESCRWVDRVKSVVNVKLASGSTSVPVVAGPVNVRPGKRVFGLNGTSAIASTSGYVSGNQGVVVEVLICNYKQQLRLTFGVPSLAHTDSELLAQELSLTVRVVGPCHPELKTQLMENLKTTKSAWARRLEGIETAVDAAVKLFKHW